MNIDRGRRKTLEGYKVFDPNRLPPEIAWTPTLVTIRRAIGAAVG